MSMPSSETPDAPAEPSTAEAPGLVPESERWSLVALIAHDGEEPPAGITEAEALGTWCAVSALWHPSLLARAGTLPRIEPVEYPTEPSARELRVVAAGAVGRLPDDYRARAEAAGAIVVEAGTDRLALVAELRWRIGLDESPAGAGAGDDGLAVAAADFLALGTARWMLRDLTTAMGHSDGLDAESLEREVLSGAHAWSEGDHPAATNRLRAGFELLTQARERFYPVDAYIVDVCLLDPSTPAGALADALASHAPVTFLAPAQAVENLDRVDAGAIAALREAITEGWADVAGGAYREVDEPLLPFESILWQFRKGAEVYRAHLDDRNVETLARRRFGLYPHLPQIAKRFGFRFAVHLGFDAGRFPIRPEAKRLWESLDGTSVETLTRPPIGADRAAQGLNVAWRLAASMKDDHVATLGMVHWPQPVAPWYVDLRRVASYSPVLARWVTMNDYFHLTDRPFETFRPEPDDYVTPYLAQAAARGDDRPVSRRALHARLRARFDGLCALRALERSVTGTPAAKVDAGDETGFVPADQESALETGRLDVVVDALDRHEPPHAAALARAIAGEGAGGRSGYVVLNPSAVTRRATVLLPDAALDLRPEGPLRAAQFTDEGVWAVVDVPAFGYAWVPREPDTALPPATTGALSVRDRLLRNESIMVDIDPATGGIRSLRASGEETARLGQQLAVAGLTGDDGAAAASRMRCDAFEVDYGGPALVQARTRGVVLDPGGARIASFQQRFRLWTGRPVLELEITLSELDAAWLERLSGGNPWAGYLACRWAWPDPNSMLRRTCLLAPELTESDRPETPDAFDISTRRQRTALLFGGLAHQQMHGARMLDTLLVTGKETERTFRLGVALDLEHPFLAATEMIAPVHVVPTESGPPRTGPTGWLFQLDTKAVAVTRLETLDPAEEGGGWGVVFHLMETAGRPARCRLRCCRTPAWARQTDFHHELVVDLQTDGDAILIDLTPYEMARVEVMLG